MPVTTTRERLMPRSWMVLGFDQRGRLPSHICRIVRIFCASSSGMLMSNSFSSAKRILMPSSESIPSSSKVLSIVAFPGWQMLSGGNYLDDAGLEVVGHRIW